MATRMNVCKRAYIMDDMGMPIGMTFAFANGNTHKVMFADFPADVGMYAKAHGFNQTLGDSFSQSGGDSNVAEAMFLKRKETLATQWAGERSGGLGDEDLAQALAIVTKRPIEEARERVAEEDKKWKEARRKHPLVAAEIARIQAERKAKKAEASDADVDDLL